MKRRKKFVHSSVNRNKENAQSWNWMETISMCIVAEDRRAEKVNFDPQKKNKPKTTN